MVDYELEKAEALDKVYSYIENGLITIEDLANLQAKIILKQINYYEKTND